MAFLMLVVVLGVTALATYVLANLLSGDADPGRRPTRLN
jgi:hypothetical protein